MNPTFTPRFELEVLHRVGDVYIVSGDAGLRESLIEHAARRPNERRSDQVLLIARLFSDEHDPCIGRALAEHGLGGITVEFAAAALLG